MKFSSFTKRTLCALLSAGMLFAASCTEKTEDHALCGYDTNGKHMKEACMTEGMYSFFLSQKKSEFLPVLVLNYKDFSGEYDELWGLTAPDGKTYEEHFSQLALEDAKKIVAANMVLYENFVPQQAYIDLISSTVENHAIEKYGSVMSFEQYLETFGTTYEDYEKLYLLTWNKETLKESLFGDEVGVMQIPDASIKKYYADIYYTVEHIFITTAYQEKIDGTRAPISEAESARRKATATEIFELVKSGASLSEVAERYPNDYVVVYPNSSAMDSTGETTNAPELGEALKQMQIGDVRSVESAFGVHILKRIETNPENYNKSANVVETIRTKLEEESFEEILATYSQKVTVDDDMVSLHTLAASPMP